MGVKVPILGWKWPFGGVFDRKRTKNEGNRPFFEGNFGRFLVKMDIFITISDWNGPKIDGIILFFFDGNATFESTNSFLIFFHFKTTHFLVKIAPNLTFSYQNHTFSYQNRPKTPFFPHFPIKNPSKTPIFYVKTPKITHFPIKIPQKKQHFYIKIPQKHPFSHQKPPRMAQYGIPRGDRRVMFAQLHGMAECVVFGRILIGKWGVLLWKCEILLWKCEILLWKCETLLWKRGSLLWKWGFLIGNGGGLLWKCEILLGIKSPTVIAT
jgi:hypothetical protein